jgi:sulfatase modifying factor 1
MRRSSRWLLALAAPIALLAACNAIWGIDQPNPEGAGDAAVDRVATDVVTDRSVVGRDVVPKKDSPSEEDVSEAAGPTPPCSDAEPLDANLAAGCADTAVPPNLILVGTAGEPPFCIDGTEVSNAQYGAFQSHGPFTMPCACDWKDGKVTQVPSGTLTSKPKLPVANVDWCDAYAYCQWAGKRMCGATTGGPLPWGGGMSGGLYETKMDQHYVACSDYGMNMYPNTNTYDPESCNVHSIFSDGGLRPVGSSTNCESFSGLYDLVGNVEEWQDSCEANTGKEDMCLTGAGSVTTPDAGKSATCGYFDQGARGETRPDVGIRCCWPP